ncbi:MAG: hypothetical protein RMK30_05175 [Anaerolineae bacterium]|nr:hypothetical protein [Anaerolineae bacterium]MDW8102247.1 hypothetical protein [Anaerolineae bacterium]
MSQKACFALSIAGLAGAIFLVVACAPTPTPIAPVPPTTVVATPPPTPTFTPLPPTPTPTPAIPPTPTPPPSADNCVACHTDAEALKAVAEPPPKKPAPEGEG